MMRVAGVADLSGHGNMGVGICHANGQFVCYDGRTGKELWSCQLGASTSDTVSCDIDGDGREEFILGTADGKLLAIGEGENGTGMIKWSVDLGTAVGTPTIADACGTGRPQVLVVAGDGVLYCIAGSEEQEAVRKR
jgi:outer membrane protein assembly factor BamB